MSYLEAQAKAHERGPSIWREIALMAAGAALVIIGTALVVKADEPTWKALVAIETGGDVTLLASHTAFPTEAECKAFLRSKPYRDTMKAILDHIKLAGVAAKLGPALCTDKVVPRSVPAPKEGETI